MSIGWSCSSQEKNSLDAVKDATMYDRDKPITIDKQRSCSLQIYLPRAGRIPAWYRGNIETTTLGPV